MRWVKPPSIFSWSPILLDLGQHSSRCAGFGGEIAIIGQRHPRRFPAQRIHDPAEILASARVRSSAVRSGKCPPSNARRTIPLKIGPIEPGCSAAVPTSYSTRAGIAGLDSVLHKSHRSRPEMLAIVRPRKAAFAANRRTLTRRNSGPSAIPAALVQAAIARAVRALRMGGCPLPLPCRP